MKSVAMHVSANDPIARSLKVFIDGEENLDCLRACEDKGWAEVASLGEWREDNQGNMVRDEKKTIIQGRVEIVLEGNSPDWVQQRFNEMRKAFAAP